jgi:hypothetical protein
MSNTLTREMLATALQRLEALQEGETPPLESEQLKQRAEEVAEVALQAVAVCVKYMLASNGESIVEGLGTFVLHDGHIQFSPESDVLQYALLKHQDQTNQQQALRDAFVKNLRLAWSILPMVESTDEMTVNVPLEFIAEDRLLGAIFGQTLPNRFDAVVTTLLSHIIRHLRSVGLTIPLADEGGEYAQRKARELRERADELIERSKLEQKKTRKDSITAAIEAGREAYLRDKEGA